MKYQFHKIFPLLIKYEKNAGKPHFDRNLRLLGPNLGHNFLMLDIIQSFNPVQYQGQL